MAHKLQNMLARVPSDIDIAQAAKPISIEKIAAEAGILGDELELYGKSKAKVHLSIRDRLKSIPNGKYVVVTAITPTPVSYTHLDVYKRQRSYSLLRRTWIAEKKSR